MNPHELTRESFFRMKKAFKADETARTLTESPVKGLGGLGSMSKTKTPDLAETISTTLTAILDNQRIMDKLNEILDAVKSSSEKQVLKKIDERIKSENLKIVINSSDDTIDTIHASSLKDAVFQIASRLTSEEAQEHQRIVQSDTSDEDD
jgi:hypothetical protein